MTLFSGNIQALCTREVTIRYFIHKEAGKNFRALEPIAVLEKT